MTLKRLVAFAANALLLEQLAELARQGDRSLSAEIRRACREHVGAERSAESPAHAMTGPGEGRGGAAGGSRGCSPGGRRMSSPYWQLRRDEPPYWRLADLRQGRRHQRKRRVEIYRALPASLELLERAGGAEAPSVLEMRFAIFNKWQEISDAQGHYLERLSPGVFRKSLNERFAGIRAVLSHGKDPSLGATVLGKIKEIREEADGAIARVALFPSVPPLLLDGLRDGVYGASFRGESIKSETNWHPGISAHNPDGIPEVTRLEIRLRDVGPTPFAAYPDTTVMVASAGAESLPARSLPAEQLDAEPTWLLRRDSLSLPRWQLQRGGRHGGRTYAKA